MLCYKIPISDSLNADNHADIKRYVSRSHMNSDTVRKSTKTNDC